MKSDANEAAIRRVLRSRRGAGRAITAPEIAAEIGLSRGRGRCVRRIIQMRAGDWDGMLVCAIPGKGYFCAKDYEEAAIYHRYLVGLMEQAEKTLENFSERAARAGFRMGHRRAARKQQQQQRKETEQ